MELTVQRHNQTVYNSMQPGDLLEFERGAYSHWAVVADDRHVIHLAAEDGDMGTSGSMNSAATSSGVLLDKAVVRLDTFWDVVGTSLVKINNKKDHKHTPLNRLEVLARATARIGEEGYNLIWRNCEHFATSCRYGHEISDQVDKVETAVKYGAGAIVLGGLFGLAAVALCGDKSKSKGNKS